MDEQEERFLARPDLMAGMHVTDPSKAVRRRRRATRRRSPAEVTYDRLVDASERYAAKLSGEERDAIGMVCQALYEIANSAR